MVNIEDHLAIRSDHETLVITLLSRFRVGGYKLNPNPDESYPKLLRDALYKCLPLAPNTHQEVEDYVKILIRTIITIRALKPTLCNPLIKWWNDEVWKV